MDFSWKIQYLNFLALATFSISALFPNSKFIKVLAYRHGKLSCTRSCVVGLAQTCCAMDVCFFNEKIFMKYVLQHFIIFRLDFILNFINVIEKTLSPVVFFLIWKYNLKGVTLNGHNKKLRYDSIKVKMSYTQILILFLD